MITTQERVARYRQQRNLGASHADAMGVIETELGALVFSEAIAILKRFKKALKEDNRRHVEFLTPETKTAIKSSLASVFSSNALKIFLLTRGIMGQFKERHPASRRMEPSQEDFDGFTLEQSKMIEEEVTRYLAKFARSLRE